MDDCLGFAASAARLGGSVCKCGAAECAGLRAESMREQQFKVQGSKFKVGSSEFMLAEKGAQELWTWNFERMGLQGTTGEC